VSRSVARGAPVASLPWPVRHWVGPTRSTDTESRRASSLPVLVRGVAGSGDAEVVRAEHTEDQLAVEIKFDVIVLVGCLKRLDDESMNPFSNLGALRQFEPPDGYYVVIESGLHDSHFAGVAPKCTITSSG
jgi:hypothetical protein